MLHKFTTSDGLSLAYHDEGTGPVLLCLSGLTRNSSDFDYVLPHLSGHRVIRLDYRGRGASDWAKDYMTYTVQREAQDVVELLDHLGLDRVPLLATSRGGLIAMALAVGAKDRLSGVCMNDIGPVIAEGGLDAIKGYLGRAPAQKTYEEAVDVRASLMAGFANVPHSRWRAEVEKHYIESKDGLQINYDPKLREAVLSAGAQPVPDLWPLFDALEGIPLATIRGANSDLLSAETLAEMQRRRPDMITAVVPDRGHVPFLDEPEALDAIHSLLKAV